MAYAFLTPADLKAGIIDKFINERSEENPQEILETIELHNISLIKSKLSGRYDTTAIFTATGSDRHYLITKILMKLTLYDFIRRNAARKVPEDYVKEMEWAMKTLEQIAAGKLRPDGLPIPVEGAAIIKGNTINQDWMT